MSGQPGQMKKPKKTRDCTENLLFFHGDANVSKVFSSIKEHYFNYMVELTIPGSRVLPDSMANFLGDEQFWRVPQMPLTTLMDIKFLEAFVRRGELCLLSENTEIEKDDCVAITSSGKLILHLTRDTYLELGLEGKEVKQKLPYGKKYVVQIDLNESCLQPGKKGYERIKRCLAENNMKSDCILTWKPQDTTISPASIVVYLDSLGVRCEACHVEMTSTCRNNVRVPVISSSKVEASPDNVDSMEFLEWLGAHVMGVEFDDQTEDSYMAKWSTPDPSALIDSCLTCRWTGLITSSSLESLFNKVRDYVSVSSSPWISLTVWGFDNSPVLWNRAVDKFKEFQEDDFYNLVAFKNGELWHYKSPNQFDKLS